MNLGKLFHALFIVLLLSGSFSFTSCKHGTPSVTGDSTGDDQTSGNVRDSSKDKTREIESNKYDSTNNTSPTQNTSPVPPGGSH
jgi:hypothetical protein